MWDYDHMGWMMNGWGMGFGFIIWLVILAVIIAGIVRFVRSRPVRGGLHVLEERYAKGEIKRDEYLQKKRDLGG
jgi:putative membrane protein